MTESGQVPDNRPINIVLDSWRKNKFLCLKGKIFAKVTQIIEECPIKLGPYHAGLSGNEQIGYKDTSS